MVTTFENHFYSLRNYVDTDLRAIDYLHQTKLFMYLESLLMNLLDGIYFNEKQLKNIMSLSKFKKSKILMITTSRCTSLDLLILFCINFKTIQNGSTIFHETQMADS